MNILNKWELNDRNIEVKQFLGDPLKDLFIKNGSRAGFEYTNEKIFIPVIFQRFIGVDGDENDYYNNLFDLKSLIGKNKSGNLFIDRGFDKQIDNSLISKLQNSWQIMEKSSKTSADYITIEIIKPYLSEYSDIRQKDLVILKIKKLLDIYINIFGLGKLYELKNIVFHLVHWHNLYFTELFKNYDYIDINPKVMYFGKISKRETYFLLLLNLMGIDVLYFNPGEDCFFKELDKDGSISQITEYPRRLKEKLFPQERTSTTVSTEAKVVSDELRETLHSDDSFLFRPWQFIDYELDSKVMHSTYEEIAIFAKEDAKMRTGWKAGQGSVTLSNFFTLIKGVHADHKRFWKEFNSIINNDMTVFVDSLPVLISQNELKKNEYYSALSKDHILDKNKLLSSSFWPYKRFPDHVQKMISSKMILLCQLKGIKRDKSIPVEIQKMKIFSMLLNIPEKYLQLLQQFDFPGFVPKVVVYNNEKNGDMTLEDATLFYFMASSGIDVFIYNPSGHNDIEAYIEDVCYDKHYLEKMEFNLQYKSKSILGRFF